jgi:hypothetical protein
LQLQQLDAPISHGPVLVLLDVILEKAYRVRTELVETSQAAILGQAEERNRRMRRSRGLVPEMLEGKVLLAAMATPIAALSPPLIAPLNQGLVVKLSTNHLVYRRGQPVVMTLTETNTSQQDITVTSGPSTDGFFVTHGGRKVWASNAGAQPMFILLRTLAPGQSITLSATWNGLSNIGAPSAPTGHLVVGSQVEGTQPVTIEIRPR